METNFSYMVVGGAETQGQNLSDLQTSASGS